MIEFLDALGAGILRSLVAIRAGLIIAAAAFLELSIAAANESERLTTLLSTFFAALAFFFGLLSAIVAVLFLVGQFRSRTDRSRTR